MIQDHFDVGTWERVSFGKVVLNKNENTSNPSLEGLSQVVGLEHMDSESLPLVRWSELSDLPDGTTFTRKFRAGQVLFGKRRSYQKKVSFPDFDGICSGDILVFESLDAKRLLHGFLPLLVQSDPFMEFAVSTSAGSLSPRTKWSDLSRFEFLLPSLKDQEDIVEIISAIDKTIDAYKNQSIRSYRESIVDELLSAGGDDWAETTLDELVISGVVVLGRGNVISKKDMEADPGPYPVYSSAQNNDGRIGSYDKYMFDEELITWSVDGGGYVFYRPHHRFSVTNIGGYLRIVDSTKFLYPFLAMVLQKLHRQHVFDWQNKAHPSVIRELYNNIPLVPMDEQKRIVEIVSSIDKVIRSTEQAVADAKALRSSILGEVFKDHNRA